MQGAEAKFQESRVLVGHVHHFTALLQAEQQTLSALERQVSKYRRQHAELDGERELLLLDMEELNSRIVEEHEQHRLIMGDLRERLEKLE